MSGDAVSIAPDVYSVVVENDRVRVLEVRMRPGVSSAMHSHPDTVVVMIKGAKTRFSEPGEDPVEMDIPDASAMFMEGMDHSVENIGTNEAHGFIIELK